MYNLTASKLMKFKFCHNASHYPEKNCIEVSYFFLESQNARKENRLKVYFSSVILFQ